MQFTTGLLALAFAISGTAAAPSPALGERQYQGFFHIQHYTEPNCEGTLITGQVFTDIASTDGTCLQPNPVTTYPSFRLRTIDGTPRPLQIFSNSDCSTANGGAVVTVLPTTPIYTCYTQQVGSAIFT
ncbi:hypothetical protein S7711_10567 [Stachybotrys chartarum IBT 7711]|uniref:Uncharacterized protein n=1 Tax=Stachybotrys chartarum (strain CBS 109288 / IBT 7711) TaxID=1280523 RepID=A0A084B124_STACB|nr:hypothetical protein S7711_10567 [Stachybotrys chartarum IBT 7711]KFA56446.1 hypothetical protein S40293_10886 [Stachybotrys chartarum IBT 40293]KFA81214.1 hypothetical protein S40288_11271 [Stachybotrys chartarum IBT 40288]